MSSSAHTPPTLTPWSSRTVISEREEESAQPNGDVPTEPVVYDIIEEPTLPKVDPHKVEWDGERDPMNPQHFSTKRKWWITVLCCLMTVNVAFASSAPSSATPYIAHEFKISAEVSYLITTVFLLGYMFGPILWGGASEVFGRRPVLCVPMVCYTLLILGQAYAKNIETLLITRFLSGVFGVSPLIVSGGVIADVWDTEGRGRASSLFTACVFLGPVLGPIISSFVAVSPQGWRWVFKVMAIFAGACTLVVLLFLPETYGPVILQKKAQKMRKAEASARKGTPEESVNSEIYAEHERQNWSLKPLADRIVFRPFVMLKAEPILALVTVYLSLVYGLLYCLFQAFPLIFHGRRGLTVTQTSLQFVGVGIGTTIGAALNLFFTRHYPGLIKRWKGFPPPEERLFGAMWGGIGLVVGIFWLGWTGEYQSVPWYVPAISTILVGMSIVLIFISFISYLVDVYLMNAASALSSNTIVRSAVAAAFPLFTTQMFQGMGINWACTLLGLVSLILAPSPFLFYKYGARIRARSKFAPCIDLKIAKMLEKEDQEAGEKAV